MERRDVVVVATVSCIYGLGSPSSFRDMRVRFETGTKCEIDQVKRMLISLQYDRNDAVLGRGTFRVKGDVIEVLPAYLKEGYRIELDWDEVTAIRKFDPLTGEVREEHDVCTVYPAKHFVIPEEQVRSATDRIREELEVRDRELQEEGKLLEAQRLRTRTEYDLEMLQEMGYCSGIENYSRHLSGRSEGERPAVLIDYFPDDFLTIIDESHVTIPQVRAMYEGDRSRKINLVNHGFRLPSALDNRPLFYAESSRSSSARRSTFLRPPGRRRWKSLHRWSNRSSARRVCWIRRSTCGRPKDRSRISTEKSANVSRAGERTLVTTLTKKMAEDLTDYLSGLGLKVRYLHSEVETFERVEILRDLRTRELRRSRRDQPPREGLDLPEVSLIIILDADKIGFLRSTTSLIQTIGRAARNVNGMVIMYADRISDAMRSAIEETDRRRAIQEDYNREHGITPKTIIKAVQDLLVRRKEDKQPNEELTLEIMRRNYNILVPRERKDLYPGARTGDARAGEKPRIRGSGGAPGRNRTAQGDGRLRDGFRQRIIGRRRARSRRLRRIREAGSTRNPPALRTPGRNRSSDPRFPRTHARTPRSR